MFSMKTSALILSLIVFSSQSFARLSDGKAHLKLKGTQIIASVDQGFHFNKDAPAALVIGSDSVEPLKKDPKEFVFDATKIKTQVVSVNFYVCDDKNTVCESHEEKYQINDGQLVAVSDIPAKVANAVPAVVKEGPLKKNKHGFYEDNLNGALKLAAKDNKLVLVDFNAPWCPSCIRLETEAFGETVFTKATDKLVKVSMDIDKVQNKAAADKYGIKAIPTLIVMNTKGEELARILDYKPAAALAKDLETIQAQQLVSAADLQKKAEAGDVAARKTLAERAFAALKYDEVVKWLAPLKEQSLLLANSEVNAGQEKYEEDTKKNSEAYQKTLEKWIAAYPKTLESIAWRTELMRVLKGEGKEAPASVKTVGAKNIAEIEPLLKDEHARTEVFAKTLTGDYTGFEKSELLSQLADTYEKMDDTKNADATKALLAKEVSTMKLSEQKPGQVLVALGYMKKANMKAEVQAWLEKLVKAYPKTDVYYTKLARYHMREKQFDKALPYAKKAAAMKSDVVLYNMQTLAEVHKNLKQTKEATQVIDKALALPEAKLDENKKTVAGLQEMKKSLVQ